MAEYTPEAATDLMKTTAMPLAEMRISMEAEMGMMLSTQAAAEWQATQEAKEADRG